MAKKALLIGINRYKIPGADLRGCVNDVENMKGVLTRMYGFASKDVTVMTDAKIISVPTERLDQASDGCRHHFDRAFMEILAERLTMANIRLSGV